MEPFFTTNFKTDCMQYSLTSDGKDLAADTNLANFWGEISRIASRYGYTTMAGNLAKQLLPEAIEANSNAPRVHESGVGPDTGL